ncbi:MAG: hypothetical protein HYV36_04135 [Lentisphaerae bacterium]|nr:hypothetical protein [Lentisphaerota bacterium]
MGPGHAPQNYPLARDGQLKPDWLRLLEDFPDRFVLGADQFLLSPETKSRGKGPAVAFGRKAFVVLERTRAFLSQLPQDLARKIAYENAITLYNLKADSNSRSR